jgi:DNA-binding winged helix-turn-helix (wHTH) protein
VPRYHFNEFVLSPRRRLLLRGGNEQPLIPRYFDLLVFLVEHRHEAVHRRDIFDRVWSDVTVSDSALSQAIRTIRRVLDDDPKEPRFIGTVSRHGYRFVFTDVREEEEDDGAWPPVAAAPAGDAGADAAARDLNTPIAAGPPVTVAPKSDAPPLTRAAGAAAERWAAASAGGALAGVIGGTLGGILLATIPGSAASFAVVPALALIGACCGAAGGAGVGTGLSAADALARSWRTASLAVGGALGGGLVGTAAQWLARWSLAALVGVRLDIGGGLEGVIIGAAAGLGYGLATSGTSDGHVDPASSRRIVALTAACCGIAALLLTGAGWPLVGGTIHMIATGSDGSQAVLTPLGRLMGETDFGPLSSAIIGTGEGLLFGLGLGLGLTRRP